MVTAGHHAFPGKDYDEFLVLYFRQHWIRLLSRMLRLALQTLLILAAGWVSFVELDLGGGRTDRTMAVILATAFLLTQFEFLGLLYGYFLRVTIFSDKKVHRIKKTLLLIDDHRSIDVAMLQNISKSQHGFLQAVFGYGSLVLDAQDSELRLHFVPHVQKKIETLLELRERARERMGWGKREDAA